MYKSKALKTNFIMNTILTLSSFVFPLITFPYVSRILLPEGTGRVSFATSVVTYFLLLSQLGIPTYGIRACARVRDDRKALSCVVHELLAINLLMSVLAYLLLGGCVFLIPKLRVEKTLIFVISFTIILNAIGMEWLYKALEQYTYITIRSVIFKAIAVIAMLLMVRQKSDYIVYGALTIFAASASNICNFVHAHKYIDFFLKEKCDLKKHLKPVLVFFAMSCATVIYTNLDTVMLGLMKGNVDVGYYNAAVKIKGILLGVVTALGTVMLPRLSYYVEHVEQKEFGRLTRKAMNVVILVATPLMIYFILFAREGIFFLSGAAYDGSVIPMQIIMPTLLLIGMTNVMGIQIMIPLGMEKQVLYSEIVGAIVDLIVNAILIPKYAASGAAVGTLMAEFVVWIVQMHALKNVTENLYKNIRLGTVGLALILAVIGSIWVKGLAFGPFMRLLISAILYFTIYYIVLLLRKEAIAKEILEQGKRLIHR